MLLIEEKQIPIQIDLMPMRSYGDKPVEFTRKVRGGLLPALTVRREDGREQTITESQVIMELLDEWHSVEEGFKPMLPPVEDGVNGARYQTLARLERDLFSWWCTLLFRPEGPMSGGGGGLMGMLTGGGGKQMSGAMRGFLECLDRVEAELRSTSGPWFFDFATHPTMIDFIYVSHVERMLASVAYWKGLNLRSEELRTNRFQALNAWLEAFEQRECYLAYKSDYYTHVKDIPPQYGPGYFGGLDEQKEFEQMITGKSNHWKLPLSHDDPLQPLYKGPPLPLCLLDAAGIQPDSSGSYEDTCPDLMAKTCREMAGWKLSGNGMNVARFAARGGRNGAKNPRPSFGAELADPYANPDETALPYVDAALRVVCQGLLGSANHDNHMEYLNSLEGCLSEAVPKDVTHDVISSLAYLRDRVGVPRDLPLASGRQFRAHLNWAIDLL